MVNYLKAFKREIDIFKRYITNGVNNYISYADLYLFDTTNIFVEVVIRSELKIAQFDNSVVFYVDLNDVDITIPKKAIKFRKQTVSSFKNSDDKICKDVNHLLGVHYIEPDVVTLKDIKNARYAIEHNKVSVHLKDEVFTDFDRNMLIIGKLVFNNSSISICVPTMNDKVTVALVARENVYDLNGHHLDVSIGSMIETHIELKA